MFLGVASSQQQDWTMATSQLPYFIFEPHLNCKPFWFAISPKASFEFRGTRRVLWGPLSEDTQQQPQISFNIYEQMQVREKWIQFKGTGIYSRCQIECRHPRRGHELGRRDELWMSCWFWIQQIKLQNDQWYRGMHPLGSEPSKMCTFKKVMDLFI